MLLFLQRNLCQGSVPRQMSKAMFSSSPSTSAEGKYGRTLEILPREDHTSTVIFMHGLGDTGYGWYDPMHEISGSKLGNHTKFLLPTAPTIPVTLNFGSPMPAWYDIVSLDRKSNNFDETRILDASKYVEEMVEQEMEKGIAPEKIIVGGFSQGGAIALFGSLQGKYKLGGVIGLSTYLPMADKFKTGVKDENKEIPVFMGHGDCDPVVVLEVGRESCQKLMESGFEVKWRTYQGLPHALHPQELRDVASFMTRILTK